MTAPMHSGGNSKFQNRVCMTCHVQLCLFVSLRCCFGYLVAVPNVFRQGANTTVDVQLRKIAYAVTVIAELVKPHQQQLEPVQGTCRYGSLTETFVNLFEFCE